MDNLLDLPGIRARMHRWTVADYEKLSENPAFRNTELVRGIILNKTFKASPLYSMAATRFHAFLTRELRAEFTARKDAPLRLADSMPSPDLSVVRNALAAPDASLPSTAELVLEIAVGNLALHHALALLYAEAGVGQYWIVIGKTEQVEVHLHPVNGIYQESRTYERGESIENVGVVDGPVPVKVFFA